MATITGPDLRRERRDADVWVTSLARHVGWSRSKVHAVEKSAAPTAEEVARYRQALEEAVQAAGRD